MDGHALAQTLGRVIAALRMLYGLSQERLALDADLDRSYFGEIERGEANPSLATLEKIACALGQSLTTFFLLAETYNLSDEHLDLIRLVSPNHSDLPLPNLTVAQIETACNRTLALTHYINLNPEHAKLPMSFYSHFIAKLLANGIAQVSHFIHDGQAQGTRLVDPQYALPDFNSRLFVLASSAKNRNRVESTQPLDGWVLVVNYAIDGAHRQTRFAQVALAHLVPADWIIYRRTGRSSAVANDVAMQKFRSGILYTEE